MRSIVWGSSFCIAALALGGCATPGMGTGIVQLSPDSYRLSRVDGVGRYADVAAMKAALVEEANAFARSQGKVAVPIASREEAMRAGHLQTAELEFRVTSAAEAAAVATAPPAVRPAPPVAVAPVMPAAPVVQRPPVAATVPPAVPASTPPAAPDVKPGLYNELIMLDDLRRRGILTDAEFQAMKTKLLAGK